MLSYCTVAFMRRVVSYYTFVVIAHTNAIFVLVNSISVLQLVLCRVEAVKKPPRTSSIVQIIFYFSPLRSEDIF